MIFKPKNRFELKKAIELYNSNYEKGKRLYGNINDWDVSEVIDMSSLLKKVMLYLFILKYLLLIGMLVMLLI